jgi:transcription elongation factor GreA-like protein
MSKKIKELKTKINPIMQSSIREIVYKMCAEKKKTPYNEIIAFKIYGRKS